MVICLEQGAHLHTAQLMPLPLTVSCFSKIQVGFIFLVLAHPGSPGQKAVKRVCVRARAFTRARVIINHITYCCTLASTYVSIFRVDFIITIINIYTASQLY